MYSVLITVFILNQTLVTLLTKFLVAEPINEVMLLDTRVVDVGMFAGFSRFI